MLLDEAVLASFFGALIPAGRCDAGGSGADALVEVTGEVLLTSAAKPLLAGDGSGRAGFDGAAWEDALAVRSDVTLNTGRPLG